METNVIIILVVLLVIVILVAGFVVWNRIKKQKIETLSSEAKLLEREGNYEEAIKRYEEAVKLKPGHAEAHYNMGNSYFYKKEYDKAIECYERAVKCYKKTVKSKPNHARAYHDMGYAYIGIGYAYEELNKLKAKQ